MSLDISSLSKDKKFKKTSLLIIIFTFFLIFLSLINISIALPSYSYKPVPPSGETSGEVNTSYQYIIYTMDAGSHWKFDWGDGTYSDWIEVGESVSYISYEQSWDSIGEYNVRIKHKNIYSSESVWSDPITVNIALPIDIDKDGYSNEMEDSYGTNPEESSDYPIDTDIDGIPDDDSSDGLFTGDFDDDNDGVYDEIEILIGSNPKVESDTTVVNIAGINHYLVDTNDNGKSEIFYNTQTGAYTKLDNENGNILIDFNKDGEYEYIYDTENGISIYEKKSETPWLLIIGIIAISIILIIFSLIKTGIIYFYEEEYIIEE